jgi:hypothetical protein
MSAAIAPIVRCDDHRTAAAWFGGEQVETEMRKRT